MTTFDAWHAAWEARKQAQAEADAARFGGRELSGLALSLSTPRVSDTEPCSVACLDFGPASECVCGGDLDHGMVTHRASCPIVKDELA